MHICSPLMKLFLNLKLFFQLMYMFLPHAWAFQLRLFIFTIVFCYFEAKCVEKARTAGLGLWDEVVKVVSVVLRVLVRCWRLLVVVKVFVHHSTLRYT